MSAHDFVVLAMGMVLLLGSIILFLFFVLFSAEDGEDSRMDMETGGGAFNALRDGLSGFLLWLPILAVLLVVVWLFLSDLEKKTAGFAPKPMPTNPDASLFKKTTPSQSPPVPDAR